MCIYRTNQPDIFSVLRGVHITFVRSCYIHASQVQVCTYYSCLPHILLCCLLLETLKSLHRCLRVLWRTGLCLRQTNFKGVSTPWIIRWFLAIYLRGHLTLEELRHVKIRDMPDGGLLSLFILGLVVRDDCQLEPCS